MDVNRARNPPHTASKTPRPAVTHTPRAPGRDCPDALVGGAIYVVEQSISLER